MHFSAYRSRVCSGIELADCVIVTLDLSQRRCIRDEFQIVQLIEQVIPAHI